MILKRDAKKKVGETRMCILPQMIPRPWIGNMRLKKMEPKAEEIFQVPTVVTEARDTMNLMLEETWELCRGKRMWRMMMLTRSMELTSPTMQMFTLHHLWMIMFMTIMRRRSLGDEGSWRHFVLVYFILMNYLYALDGFECINLYAAFILY